MTKSKKKLLKIRNESYRVVHAEVCGACRHWQRLRATDIGLCVIVTARGTLPPKPANCLGTCDLWEGKQRDK